MYRMLAALCLRHAGSFIVADGDDADALFRAYARTQETRLPLLLFARNPDALSPPAGIEYHLLPRPFSFEEFHAAAHLLSGEPFALPATPNQPSAPTLRWDSVHRVLQCGDDTLVLTAREADIFSALYDAAPEIVSQETLMRGFTRTAGNAPQVYITYLRKKLAALPVRISIVSHRGKGYSLLLPPTADQI